MAERHGEVDGALAEYSALRQEIDTRASRQNNILTTQLITAGALFSFALSGVADDRMSRNLIVLLVPITSYLLLGRYADNVLKMRRIHGYLRDQLAPRLPGLHWERWADDNNKAELMVAVWVAPIALTFPGASIAALLLWLVTDEAAGTFPASIARFLVAADVVAIIASVTLVFRLIYAFRGRWWPWKPNWRWRGTRSNARG